jgi:hypothetical protein
MAYARTATLKVGDTFGLTCTYRVAGVATAITTQQFASQVRTDAGKLVANLSITLGDQNAHPGQFQLTVEGGASTQGWPADQDLYCDIQTTDGGVVRSTETFVIPTAADVTRS